MNLNNSDFDILDDYSKKSFSNLKLDYDKREMTLICGAGTSMSAGLPSWNKYLKKITRIFLIHWEFLERTNKKYLHLAPKEMSIAFIGDYYDISNTELENDFTKEDPLILAQLIKNCIRAGDWKYLLKKALYGEEKSNVPDSELINLLCLFIINSNNFKSIITYNYDDILEFALKKRGFLTDSIIKENDHFKSKNFPVYHPHGILPFFGGIDGKIYLSEEDYLTDIIEPNSWYNQLHSTKLTSTCCLFIGLSFNDPSLKRKLAVHKLNPNHFHYAIMTHENTEFEHKKFLLLRNELLRLNVRIIKYDYDKNHENLTKVIGLIYKYIIKKDIN